MGGTFNPLQSPDGGHPEKKGMYGNYKYQIVVESQPESAVVMCNGQIDKIQRNTTRGWSDLGAAIASAYKSSITQKTVNASANLISLGINYATELIQKPVKDFKDWSTEKEKQCTYKKDLSSQETIDDFYYRPSANGALDPRDLKFNGFVCRNFIESSDINGGQADEETGKQRLGQNVFYVSCRLRTDSLGIARLTNHSKFMLEVDSLVFNPKYCNIPNENPKNLIKGFNYKAHTGLQLEMNVKILSSWVNEAIMITSDYELGEFTIKANIDEDALRVIGNDTLFVYNGHTPETDGLVSIVGESFIVPRSFVGTSNEPLWGTGQYKLAIEVTESCLLNAQYYLNDDEYVKIDEVGNGAAVNFANLPGHKMWNKAIWKEEWRSMQQRKKGDSFMTNAWKEIKTAYIGNNWVKELVDPAVTQFLQFETKELHGLFKLDEETNKQHSPHADC